MANRGFTALGAGSVDKGVGEKTTRSVSIHTPKKYHLHVLLEGLGVLRATADFSTFSVVCTPQ